MKILISNIILVLIVCNLNAQNIGYSGKRFLIKTTAIHGIKSVFTGLELEAVPLRKITFTVGYKIFSSNVSQKYDKAEYVNYEIGNSDKLSDKAKVKTQIICFEARKYLGSAAIPPAPSGIFLYASFTNGQINVEGNYYRSLLEYKLPGEQDEYLNYDYQNINTYSIEAGGGYQWFVYQDLVTLGLKAGLNYTNLRIDFEGTPTKTISGVAKYYGPNVVAIHISKKMDKYHYEEIKPSTRSYGLSFYFQVGIMLF